jgi:hypothetical protein
MLNKIRQPQNYEVTTECRKVSKEAFHGSHSLPGIKTRTNGHHLPLQPKGSAPQALSPAVALHHSVVHFG